MFYNNTLVCINPDTKLFVFEVCIVQIQFDLGLYARYTRINTCSNVKVHVQLIFNLGIIVNVRKWTDRFVQKLINVVTDNVIT